MLNNDLQLFHQARGGSVKAFEVLFRRYYAPLCGYAHRFTNNPDHSEELVQELFYKLWKDRAQIDIDLSVKSYLYEAIRNKALHYLEHLRVRERYRQEIKTVHHQGYTAASPDVIMEARECENRISEIMDKFPNRRRKIFCMNRFGGDKYMEIATKLSISVKTVEVEMHKAIKALKAGLDAG
ncbi:MAG: RNA polymerase sigma-70 factor [Prevotellaceae bacterium]|jgi:RNA polymerase sigma-70 factor (ECF subfamily)|nr:RNA polymerase sigma-70 factor [Prevotellaceae bacterium]